MIRFVYQRITYQVDLKAYDENLIQLPNGVVLQAEAWDETSPPQPVDLTPIDPNFKEGYSPPLAEQVSP